MNKRICALLVILMVVATTLMLPSTGVAQEQTNSCEDYVVQAGDSLSEIADEILGNPAAFPSIVEATNEVAENDDSYATIANPSSIRQDAKLCIPIDATVEAEPTEEVEATEETIPAAESTEPVEETATAEVGAFRNMATEIDFLGNVNFETGFTFEETEVGGLSGIVYDPANDIYYALSDDPSQNGPA